MSHRHTTYALLAGAMLALWACGPKIRPIDLHDRTIPIEARRLVADAEDSIDIARAKLDEAERERRKTESWKQNLLDRDWPSEASSAVSELQRLAEARVELAELEVERAEENVELAEAKYELITAKTAIRHDLAVYELEPLRRRVDREGKDVEKLDSRILNQRQKIAQLSNNWWDAYAELARGGGKTRAFFVSAAEKLPTPKLRGKSSDDKEKGDEKGGDASGGE